MGALESMLSSTGRVAWSGVTAEARKAVSSRFEGWEFTVFHEFSMDLS